MNYRKKITILCLLIYVSNLLYAQNKVDSLLLLISKNNKNDTIKINQWLQIASFYQKSEKGIAAVDTAISMANKIKNTAKLGEAYQVKATNYYFRDQYSLAIDYFNKAIEIYKVINHLKLAATYANLGLAYHYSSDYAKASDAFYSALGYYEKQHDLRGQGLVYTNLARLYSRLGNKPKRLECNLKAMSMGEQLKDSVVIANACQGLGVCYSAKNRIDAKKYFLRSLRIFESLNDKRSMASVLGNLANLSETYNDFSLAINYLNRAEKICEEGKYPIDLVSKLLDMSNLYDNAPDSVLLAQGVPLAERRKKVFEYINRAFAITKEANQLQWQSNSMSRLSKAYEKQKEYKQAYDAYKIYVVLRDSIVNDKTNHELMKREIQYEYDKKEAEIKLQQTVTDAKLREQQLLNIQEEEKFLLQKNELALATKEKNLQHLAWLRTQAELQNSELEKQRNSRQLSLVQNEKELQQVKLKTLAQEKEIAQKQVWTYSLLIFATLMLLGVYFFNKYRIKQLQLEAELTKEKVEQQLKASEFENKMNMVTLSALRSQMNPHFIFNCLNSIKLYSLENDSKAASDYLTKFSRLMRLVLENSRSEKVTLDKELEVLTLYTEMEIMRFKGKVQFRLNIAKNIDQQFIEIPPLLLQPFIENSIWHGLMHKEEGGTVTLNILQEEENLLHVEIIDNGIGREKAAEYKSKTATRNKSFGMKVTGERIALINQIYRTDTHVQIIDLKNNENNAIGTKVVLSIPI